LQFTPPPGRGGGLLTENVQTNDDNPEKNNTSKKNKKDFLHKKEVKAMILPFWFFHRVPHSAKLSLSFS